MLGAITGDIVGSIYEFDNIKNKDFEFFDRECFFTDDTVMSVAVGEALLDMRPTDKEDEIEAKLVTSMKKWGREYPYAGYGGSFCSWLRSDNTSPYNSYGNGSAMRVASAGWLYEDMFTTRYMARLTSEVTHNHIEGIKGAEATAAAIFLARNGASKQEIREYIEKEFSYNLNFTCDEIRPTYYFNETCMDTVPQAIVAFLDGESFEDVIRTGVSIGGDTDTLCAIAGSIAEAYYGIPEDIGNTAKSFLTVDLLEIVEKFYKAITKKETCI